MVKQDTAYDFGIRIVDGFTVVDLVNRETQYFSEVSESCGELRNLFNSTETGLIVNLKNVTGVSSLFIGQLAGAASKLKSKGVPFGVAGPNINVLDVLHVTNIRSLLTVGATVEDTIRLLKEGKTGLDNE